MDWPGPKCKGEPIEILLRFSLDSTLRVVNGDICDAFFDLANDIRLIAELPSASACHGIGMPTNSHEMVEGLAGFGPCLFGPEHGKREFGLVEAAVSVHR